ncbi:hypothetical protein FSARC_386 [Fusarium sarcochroum]|uniref:Aromatic-L-amino-acid decarboxylase n=1 Tax=Fusarium sarcochroum TaxID=1208366 RepID=A0A8H4UBE1_9HYPO|nr:hypothetical protein FSARC_386 [Fusarium sarcochroum]
MNVDEFRERAKEAIDQIADYHESVPFRPVVSTVEPNYLAPQLPTSAPLDPEPWTDITADIQSKIMPGITHWSHPGFIAFFCCTSSYPSAIAEMWSTAFNGAHFNWICSPAVTELEVIVMDWLAKLTGLPECFLSTGPTRGGGVIHGSASEAILTVMVAARDKFLTARTSHLSGAAKEDETRRIRGRLAVIGSTGTHSSTKKAAQILGVEYVTIPVHEKNGFAMQGRDLTRALSDLDARGLEPFFLTTSLGTIEVCAVDDFTGIASALASRSGTSKEVWVHVDAAYAGAALVLDENKPIAAPFHHFHSFNFNPQKWLLTTFDCSALWVRQRSHLTQSSLSVKPPYLRHESSNDDEDVVDYRDWQIPLARRFRALKLWFVMRAYGVRGLQSHVRQGIILGKSLENKLRSRSDLFCVLTPARFGLFTFCLRECDGNTDTNNKNTKALCDKINAGGHFFLTGSTVHHNFSIRVCTSGASAQEETMEKLFDHLKKEARLILGQDSEYLTGKDKLAK